MIPLRAFSLIAAVAVLAAAAPPPTLTPTGPAVSCLERRKVQSIKVIDARTLLFETTDGRSYRSDLPQDCAYNPNFEQLLTISSSSNFCDGETLQRTRLTAGVNTGVCRAGPFTPVTQTKAP